MERSDRKGFFQTLPHIALVVLTGALAAVFFEQGQWTLFALALWLEGTFGTFLAGPALHELGHGTVFRTRAFNRFFLRLLALRGLWNHNEYRMSHTFHHRYTLYRDADHEVLLPQTPSLHPLLLLEMFTINVRGMIRVLLDTIRMARGQFDRSIFVGSSPSVNGARGATQWTEALSQVHPETYRAAVRWARIVLLFHATVIVISIVFQLWWIAIVVTGANFIGNWWRYFVVMPQHAGLRENVPDFRLSVRSMRLDPVSEFLYWHMNWHTEHHMFAGVPCYNLKRLHQVIAADMPQPRTFLSAWREMRDIAMRQQTDPDYQFDTPLPGMAYPGITGQSAVAVLAEGADALAVSIGDMDPDEDENATWPRPG